MQGSFGCLGCGRLVDEHDSPETTGAAAQTQLGTQVREALLESRWRLIQPLGRGRAATTWLARDTSFDRPVVVKLLDGAEDAAQVERFESSARRLAALEHKNVVAVLSLGRHQGVPFVAMQKAEGRSLAEHLHARGGKLPAHEAAHIVAQVAEAFEAAGPQGSVQPRAIFVSEGPDAVVKLLDVRGGPQLAADVTERTERVQWVAPEVLAGAAPDARGDVFTLGAVARELSGDAAELRAVLARAMNADRAERFASPAELQQALLPYAVKPAEAPTPPTPMSAPRPSRPAPPPRPSRPRQEELATKPMAPVVPPPPPAAELERPTKKTAVLSAREARIAAAAALLIAFAWIASRWETAPPPRDAVEPVPGLPLPPPRLRVLEDESEAERATAPVTETVAERKQTFERLQSEEKVRGSRSRATAKVGKQVADYLGRSSFGELQVLVTYGGREVTAIIGIDGQPIGPSPVFLPLKPGPHSISVERRPLEAVKVPAMVAAGKSVRMEIELVPLE